MKILIIEDEEDIRYALRSLLEPKGYEITEADGGKAGLEALSKLCPDLILCDFFMPGMNGRQVLEEIRKKKLCPKAKTILLTVATFGKEGSDKLKQLKVADYIKKPFENKDLVARIKKVLGQK
jgi:CheY-like chemotaxis protein